MSLQTYDTIQVSLTTSEVLSVLAVNLEEWKARAIRNTSHYCIVSDLLLVVETGKYKVGDTYQHNQSSSR
jgi:hypothetical protein